MRRYAISGFDTFRCIAGKCTDTCCVGWDVVIDDETAGNYRSMQSSLGRKISEKMVVDADGDTIFEAVNGRCPFLRTDGLCEIQANCGEDALSVTCRRFPRIVAEYEDFTEYTLSLSCPEANRILLTQKKLTAPIPQTEYKSMQALAFVRDRMISIVQDESVPFGTALCRCLSYAGAVQDGIYECSIDPDVPVPEYPKGGEGDVEAIFALFREMDLMTDEFRSLSEHPQENPRYDRQTLENIAVCYLYRYVLQAVEDGDVLSKVLLMLTAVTFSAFADGDLMDTARLFSKEVEHSYENLELLENAFFENPNFSSENFYAIWN